jgi:hypothetical protein
MSTKWQLTLSGIFPVSLQHHSTCLSKNCLRKCLSDAFSDPYEETFNESSWSHRSFRSFRRFLFRYYLSLSCNHGNFSVSHLICNNWTFLFKCCLPMDHKLRKTLLSTDCLYLGFKVNISPRFEPPKAS